MDEKEIQENEKARVWEKIHAIIFLGWAVNWISQWHVADLPPIDARHGVVCAVSVFNQISG